MKAKDPKEDEMALIASDKGGEGFEPVPAGTYVARCISVVDLGVQDTPWGGKEKVYLGFEIPEIRVEWKDKEDKEHEGPALIGNRYTLSIHPDSNLGQHLINWRGVPFTEEERKGFDLFTVLGAPCMMSVIHNEKNGKTYANISAIMRLPKGTVCPDVETEMVAYTPQDPDKADNFDKLPDWLKKLVRQGYRMAEGSTVVGSAQAAQNAAGGPIAPGQPAPRVEDEYADGDHRQPPDGGFDDDIPF